MKHDNVRGTHTRYVSQPLDLAMLAVLKPKTTQTIYSQ